MNIFMTDPCPIKSAHNLCYVHTVKMILECAQLLSTTHRVFDNDSADTLGLYKKTHINHPCALWCRQSSRNYLWVYDHMIALGGVYFSRTGVEHKTITKLRDALKLPPKGLQDFGVTEMKPAMPDCIKNLSCSVFIKYQLYLTEKYNEWKLREKPIKVDFVVAKPEWFV